MAQLFQTNEKSPSLVELRPHSDETHQTPRDLQRSHLPPAPHLNRTTTTSSAFTSDTPCKAHQFQHEVAVCPARVNDVMIPCFQDLMRWDEEMRLERRPTQPPQLQGAMALSLNMRILEEQLPGR